MAACLLFRGGGGVKRQEYGTEYSPPSSVRFGMSGAIPLYSCVAFHEVYSEKFTPSSFFLVKMQDLEVFAAVKLKHRAA